MTPETIVNGHPAETGCYVDGHWGQYGPDHVADRAEEFGWAPDGPGVQIGHFRLPVKFDPRVLRAAAEQCEEIAAGYDAAPVLHRDSEKVRRYRGYAADAWDRHHEAADAIEKWLNDHTAIMCATCGAAISWADDANSTLDEPQWVHVDWGEHEEPTVPRRFIWHWRDGEFFLSPICDDPETCDDDTCAHWE